MPNAGAISSIARRLRLPPGRAARVRLVPLTRSRIWRPCCCPGRGEASGVALARQVLDVYAGLAMAERIEFFRLLARDFGPDLQGLRAAWSDYDKAPTPKTLSAASRRRAATSGVVPPAEPCARRHERPGRVARKTSSITAQRTPSSPASTMISSHLLYSWFNRGFLMMQRITWSSPADILERIIRYEAVHMIQGWDDLRRRRAAPRSPMLRLLSPIARRRASDLRRGGADEATSRPQSRQLLADERKALPPKRRPRRSSTRSAIVSRACAASRSAIS